MRKHDSSTFILQRHKSRTSVRLGRWTHTYYVDVSDFADHYPLCSAMLQLPFELLTACLHFADLPTRVRASHTSREWRDIALSERGLWADFACTTFVSEEDQHRTYYMLKTMLQRSHPLPFRLRIPHSHFGDHEDYESAIAGAVSNEVHRLQEYDGPAYVFCCLGASGTPLPELTSFICRDHEDPPASISIYTSIAIEPEFDSLRLPNLRRLVGPILEFSASSPPYAALRELVCTLPIARTSEQLLRCCPFLVTAEFLGVHDAVRLPHPPFPRTLRHITLHGRPYGDGDEEQDGVDFTPLLAWQGQDIPYLTLIGAQSIHYPIAQFLAHCNGNISLRVSPRSPDVTLASEDGSRRWEIGMCASYWEPGRLAHLLELVADRLANLSMCIEHIGEFFNARFHAPHLVSLELRLTGVIDDSLPVNASSFYFVHAPRLQHLTLEFSGSGDNVEAHENYINGVLSALRGNFRSLLVYDADILETFTVRSTARVVQGMNCADFARFARRFIASDC